MASMVAKACNSSSCHLSPSMTRGSRNKRKYRADPPMADPNKLTPSPQSECLSCEFTADKFETVPSHRQPGGCDMCSFCQERSDSLKLDLGLSCTIGSSDESLRCPIVETEARSEFHDVDWSDFSESQLEELVMANLDAMFKSAIKKIVAFGYSEDVVVKAFLRSGLCYACNDIMSNIVDGTLMFLRSGQEIDPSREHYFDDLQQMEKYILAEMVSVVREVRPSFSTGDAMWCLLISDMNVSHACAMDSEAFISLTGDGASNGSSSTISSETQLLKETKSHENHQDSHSSVSSHSSPSEAPLLGSSPSTNDPHLETPTRRRPKPVAKNSLYERLKAEKEKLDPKSLIVSKSFSVSGTSHAIVSEEKFMSSRKISGITKREYILRQKSIHLEKSYRTYGCKGSSRAGKLSSFSGLILDKKIKPVSDSPAVGLKKASMKLSKAVGVSISAPQGIINDKNLRAQTGRVSSSAVSEEHANNTISAVPKTIVQPEIPSLDSPSALSVADTELSLSFPAKKNVEAPNPSYSAAPHEKFFGNWVPQDKKDEMIIKLVPRARELQNQLQEWTEWANQKVMQVARRLGKDKTELKQLRQDKEEVERLKKEKQTLEDNTMKKLYEMENALCKASGQVERANSTVRRLEVENANLRLEMEAAKLRAVESAASCEEVSKREKKTLLQYQSLEKQKAMFQEELIAESRKLAQLQQELELAKDMRDQLEAKWRVEAKATEQYLTQANSLRIEREQIESSSQLKEELTRQKADKNLQRYRDDIVKLEKELSLLRLKTDSSKIAALKRGVDGSYASRLADIKASAAPIKSHKHHISKMVDELFSGGVKRERECVMCLSEEMSVVFLPCAHQVVCTSCNELHEKQGMKDCPSCRGQILHRICVRFARS